MALSSPVCFLLQRSRRCLQVLYPTALGDLAPLQLDALPLASEPLLKREHQAWTCSLLEDAL